MEDERGYDFEFVDMLNEGQKCSICLFAMRDTVQTNCGHRYCKNCLLRTFRESNERLCPQDRIPLPEEGGIFCDVAWDRDILSLRVKCNNSDRGCEWKRELRNHETHLTVCQKEDVLCDDCNGVMQRMDLDAHMTFECPERQLECEHCDKRFAFRRIKDHEDNECVRFPMDCLQNCGMRKIPREENKCLKENCTPSGQPCWQHGNRRGDFCDSGRGPLEFSSFKVERHVKVDCSMTVVYCPYRRIGCNFYDKRSKLNDHIKASTEYHLRKSSTELIRVRQKLGGLEDRQRNIEGLKLENELMKSTLARNGETIKQLKLSEEQLHQDNNTLKKEIIRLSKKIAELEEINVNALSLDKNVKEMNKLFEAMGEVLNRRKENDQSATKNKRKREDENEVVLISPERRKIVKTSSNDACTRQMHLPV